MFNYLLSAAHLLDSIDFTQDPCENFYHYACNKWNKNHPIPSDTQTYNGLVLLRYDMKEKMKGKRNNLESVPT